MKNENLEKSETNDISNKKTETDDVQPEVQETNDVNMTSDASENNDSPETPESNNELQLKDNNGNDIADTNNKLPPNKTITVHGVEYKTDAKGKIYECDGKPLANITYELDGHVYKADNNGNIYEIDGKSLANITYEIDGHEYRTDDNGKIYKCDGKLVPNIMYTINGNEHKTDADGVNIIEKPEDYTRSYIRQDVKDAIYKDATRDKEGNILDANTGLPIKGKPDIGHKAGHEFWREAKKAFDEGLTQKEFNDRMNNPDYYQLEDPSNNRSHKFEDKSDYEE